MGSEGLPIDIIIFAAIAAFIVLRLRSVLGRRTGNERPPPTGYIQESRRREGESDKVVNFPDRVTNQDEKPDRAFDAAKPGSSLAAGLGHIKKADKSFNADEFLAGARAAFEMIIEAFAGGQMGGVKPYLSPDVYANFDAAVKERQQAGETLETTLVGVNGADILEARMEGRDAFITVKFVSEQINVTRDKDGKVVDGDPDHVTEITDIWTFGRDVRSRDPNWLLVETRSSN